MSLATVPERLVEQAASWLSATFSRRGFLMRAAVAGSALAVDPVGYVLKPGTAYAAVCGDGASCTSGWTAFCCTVNRGVNKCPPGTLAAGWWKADGASLCGGGPRYIIDCNARCTCTSGCGSFCTSSCWTCRCHCGPSTSCDQRRVCCNVFRYGQCNQQVGCVGPVACRVVTCTPPYRFEACSTAAATDNRTRNHNAPCNTTAWTPITARYTALGSQGSALRATKGPQIAVTGGSLLRCEGGTLYHSTATGVRYVLPPILARYVALGETRSVLGFPTGDTHLLTDRVGRYTTFRNGSLFSHPSLGTFAVLGAVRDRYTAMGYLAGGIGYPITDTLVAADGASRYNRFQRGTIMARPGLPPLLVHNAIERRWRALGAERSRLGYPIRDQHPIPGGQQCTFQGGSIRYYAATGTVTVTYTLR